ncbi:MAG: universal stress protein [Syntrophorhabdaceae bacterium]|nr:universal stress protein [Syntrophorhabdaceae bacterium]
MEDVKRILVVSRSTEECKKAFHYGVSLARAYGAELSILHIEYDPFNKVGLHYLASLGSFQEEYRAHEKQVREELDAMIREEKAVGMAIKEMVEQGEPVQQTLEAVKKCGTDLIIMAAHEEGRIERMIYGRSTHEILRRLPCSLMLVKGELSP